MEASGCVGSVAGLNRGVVWSDLASPGGAGVHDHRAAGGVNPGGDRQGTRGRGDLPSRGGMGGEHCDRKEHYPAGGRGPAERDPVG